MSVNPLPYRSAGSGSLWTLHACSSLMPRLGKQRESTVQFPRHSVGLGSVHGYSVELGTLGKTRHNMSTFDSVWLRSRIFDGSWDPRQGLAQHVGVWRGSALLAGAQWSFGTLGQARLSTSTFGRARLLSCNAHSGPPNRLGGSKNPPLATSALDKADLFTALPSCRAK